MDHIHFKFNQEKAFQVINYFNEHLPLCRLELNRLGIIKLLFIADYYHLNHYNRFICGGDYYAMPHGPVNSEFYELIKHNEKVYEDNSIVKTNVEVNYKKFSKSDREALDQAIRYCKGQTAWQLRDMTHKWKPYNDHYKEGTSNIIPTEEIIVDSDKIKYIQYWQKEYEELDRWLMNER